MLEGSVAVTGALVQWLRDNLGLIESAADIEALAASVPDSDGCVIVPAFSGPLRAALAARCARRDLRPDAASTPRRTSRARRSRRPRMRRASWSTRWSPTPASALPELRVDGGMTANELLLQIQADVLGLPVVRPAVTETTALGAAYAAGLAVGFWESLGRAARQRARRAHLGAATTDEERERGYRIWNAAVERSLDWV